MATDNGGDNVKPCGVNNREGGQRRAWHYHFVQNLYSYRMVVLGNLGMEQIDLDTKLPSV